MKPKVAVIGLDGADPSKVREYIAEGRLPALAKVVARSREVHVRTESELFHTSVWPCLASGQSVASHGLHAFRPLKSGTTDVIELKDFALPMPFWETASRAGIATTVVDFPFYGPLHTGPGAGPLQVVEWGPHPGARPSSATDPSLLARLIARHGLHPCVEDDSTLMSATELESVHARVTAGARTRGAVVSDLIEWTRPDLLVAVLPEIHTAGHQFMNHEASDHRVHDPRVMAGLAAPTRDAYEAVDHAVGQIVAKLPSDTTLLVVPLLGLRVTHGGGLLLNDLLVRCGITVRSGHRRARERVSKALTLLPPRLARALRRRRAAVDLAVRGKPAGPGLDWSRTQAFALTWAYEGYLRVNLRGREPCGIVEPGAEQEALLSRIESLVRDLKLEGTSTPAARRIVRPQVELQGKASDELPDLMVLWNNDRPFAAVESAAVGRLENRDRAARSTHGPDGQVFASGPRIAGGPPIEARDFDLAPTILRLVGVAPPPGVDGRPIEQLFGRA